MDEDLLVYSCPVSSVFCGSHCIWYVRGHCKKGRYPPPATCNNAYTWNRFWNRDAAWTGIAVVRLAMEGIYRSTHRREFLVNKFGQAVKRR